MNKEASEVVQALIRKFRTPETINVGVTLTPEAAGSVADALTLLAGMVVQTERERDAAIRLATIAGYGMIATGVLIALAFAVPWWLLP